MIKATSDSWETLPFPNEHEFMVLDRIFSTAELIKIEKGFIPSTMEEKWFVYCENNTIYIHRSWTGYCIYILDFDDNGKIIKARVNRNQEQYTATDLENDEALVLTILDTILK